jgi:fumarate hydratase subunit alpha
MRELPVSAITDAVARLCIEAACDLPDSLCQCIESCAAQEESPVGQGIFRDMIDNYTLARDKRLPICQDTGMAVVFLRLGQEVHLTGGLLTDAVNAGVAKGYTEGFLRKSVVSDPLRRVNTNDNTPAVLHLELVAGDRVEITVAPKGFGSENMSAMKMFTPAATRESIEDFIAEVADRAGSNPCPPMVLGVGLGGTIEQCALEAKRALLRDAGAPNPDPYYAEMERNALAKVNRLGIGPQGMGGTVTALAVHINPTATHIAGLPCVVNVSCHVTRHADAVL